MSALAALMIVSSAGLALTALLGLVLAPGSRLSTQAGVVVGAISAGALAAAGALAVSGEHILWRPFHWLGLGRGGVHVDALAGLFVLLAGLTAVPLFIACGRAQSRAAPTLRPLLVLCVVGVFVVDNVFEFLIVWELTVLAIYALICARRDDPRAPSAAALTLTLAKLSGAGVLVGLVLLGTQAGSYSFEALAHLGPLLDTTVRSICFALFLAGFAAKAALVPLQTWVPAAYGEVDADSSGFVAAIALNVAFYAMLRFWLGFLGHAEIWWAVVVLALGAITALVGILGGVLQRELRRFVAYSSVENSGLIVADLGIALMGQAQHRPALLELGLVAATFQIGAHSFAKAGLFGSVASVERTQGTSDMERLGGLYRLLPTATLAALCGAGALAALPPFSGFVSEWLGLEGLMQGFRVSGTVSQVTMALTAAVLALTAGLAALAFVRAIGLTFMGLPREGTAGQRTPPKARLRSAYESSYQRVALLGLALASLAMGVAAPWVVKVLLRGTAPVGAGAAAGAHISQPEWLIEPGYTKFSSISPTTLALALIGFACGAALIRVALSPRRRARVVPVWASGTVATGRRMQYSALGYSNMVRVIFNVIYRVRTQFRTHGDERFPERLSMSRADARILDPAWLYRPLTAPFLRAAGLVRNVQAGPLGLYLLYVLVVVVVLLIFAPRLAG
jgi:hydrogenase-4 component B